MVRLAGVLVFAMTWTVVPQVLAQDERGRRAEYPPVLESATVEVYKSVGDVKLNIYEFFPAGHAATDRRAAIVFFFGGGWRSGSPKQFEKQCQYLASRGMVALAADYRVSSRHGVKADRCVADAKSAIRWVRAHAARLGVDPERIVASGGSAGGHLAACTGTIADFDEPGEDASVSSRPSAMILFNPAVVLSPVEGELPLRDPASVAERMGVEPRRLSPYHHVAAGEPPTLIVHGKADETVPYKTVEWFARAMTEAGNRCELEGYAGAGHGFFNFGRSGSRHFRDTTVRMDCFLVSLGYLDGEPTVEEFLEATSASP